jgi:CRP/FNR family cyclic AMP-dependent transcriptional regulator
METRPMEIDPLSTLPARPMEDPLAYLPCSLMFEYLKGQQIYGVNDPCAGIFLVLSGSVKVCRSASCGRHVVVDLYPPEEFFGESALLGEPQQTQFAIALENTRVMTWTTEQIEEIVALRPKLAIGLFQLLVRRSVEFGSRIESLSAENISRRLALSLIRFSQRLGTAAADGSIQMIPLTHELLSQYVGTSREAVTQYMNQFRRQGYVRYSRHCIVVQQEALKGWLNHATVAA